MKLSVPEAIGRVTSVTGSFCGGRGWCRLLDFQPCELGSNPQPVHLHFLSVSVIPVERGATIPRSLSLSTNETPKMRPNRPYPPNARVGGWGAKHE
jgi:hypothetical protein